MPAHTVERGRPAAYIALGPNAPELVILLDQVLIGVPRSIVVAAVGFVPPQRLLALGTPAPRRHNTLRHRGRRRRRRRCRFLFSLV